MHYLVLFLALILSSCSKTTLPFSVHGLFTDNMVLQRDTKVRVWGWGTTGSKVEISIAGQTYKTKINGRGKWEAMIGPLAAGGPHQVNINSGIDKIQLNNVLVGDVYLASGQSNMHWKVGASAHLRENIASANNYNNIRFFTVQNTPQEKPQQNIKGSWLVNDQNTVQAQSAVAYAFAKRIQDDQKIPIGIIHSSWGNTKIEYWMSKNSLKDFADYKDTFAEFEVPRQFWFLTKFQVDKKLVNKPVKMNIGQMAITKTVWLNGRKVFPDAKDSNVYTIPAGLLRPISQMNIRLRPRDSSLEAIQKFGQGIAATALYFPKKIAKLDLWQSMLSIEQEYPTVLYNAMISTIAPYNVKAVLWYQGEANVPEAQNYPKLFKAMVSDWRKLWGSPELPFFSVQLASYKSAEQGEKLPEFRLVQAKLADEVENHYMATAVDLGDRDGDVHPKEKEEVGRRLALLALDNIYNKDLVASGPKVSEFKKENGAIRLVFDHSQLKSRTGTALRGFEIEAADGKYQPVAATIDGSTVLIDGAGDAKSLRYAWGQMPRMSLYNSENLPTEPFKLLL